MSNDTTGINWREWNDEAFAESRRQDKPILLDIGAVWCHWCHVMDSGIAGDPIHTGTYSNLEVQRRIAENFIPIKVDNDRRPDVNARYNMGGWPTTVIITADGDILYGETYVTPDRMVRLLDHIDNVWRTQREQVLRDATKLRFERDSPVGGTISTELDPSTVVNVTQSLKQHFDKRYGGFGTEPKFPHADAIHFAVEQSAITGDVELAEVARVTMHNMASGGMYDQFAGGFFRYSTTRDWTIPHYEKMLEDNAKLTTVYQISAGLWNDAFLQSTVESAHRWMFDAKVDTETGAFSGSQDADGEQAYYGQPLNVRGTMPTPFIDRRVYTGWNCLAVSSLITRYAITGEHEILERGQRAFQFIDNQLLVREKPAGALYHYNSSGKSEGPIGLLEDQTNYLMAAMDLFGVTGQSKYRDCAIRTADFMLNELEDCQNGGFYDIRVDKNALGHLAIPKKDMNLNAAAALSLVRLSALTNIVRYRQSAIGALTIFRHMYDQMAYFAASYARAVDAVLRDSLRIVISGDLADERTKEMMRSAWLVPFAGRSVELALPSRVSGIEQITFPLGADGSPRAYICEGTTCRIAVNAVEIQALLSEEFSA